MARLARRLLISGQSAFSARAFFSRAMIHIFPVLSKMPSYEGNKSRASIFLIAHRATARLFRESTIALFFRPTSRVSLLSLFLRSNNASVVFDESGNADEECCRCRLDELWVFVFFEIGMGWFWGEFGVWKWRKVLGDVT